MTPRYPAKSVLTIAVVLGVVLAFSGTLQADPAIYEPFNYEAGAISGENGGIGFTGVWASTRNNPAAAEPGLIWGSLPVEGNTAQGAAWSGLTRPIGSTLTDAGLMTDGATLWFSVVFDLEGQNTTNADLNLALGTDKFVSGVFGDRENLNTGEGIGVTHSGAVIQGVYWQNSDADDVAERVEKNSSVTINGIGSNLSRALIVGRIDWGASSLASETLTLYAPNTDLEPGDPTMAAWTIPALDQSQFDLIALQFKDTSKMDEIRFGATYEDVVGNPPPPPVLTLRVDPVTGATTLLGDDYRDVDINYYEITSDGDSLDSENWASLADQDFEGSGPPNGTGDGWEEAGGVGKHALAEAFLLGNSTVSIDQAISLGMGYDAFVGAEDLVFKYVNDEGEVVDGIVEYVTSIIPGDANWDGVVDAADYIALKRNFGSVDGATYHDGDFDGDHDVDLDDLAILAANFGEGPEESPAIPEPAALSLMGLAGLAIMRRRRAA